jgi:protoporphyrinogen/coproporphyrinogen III oxidase
MAVVVAGGGITGLAAAWELAHAGIPVDLYEASDRLGGKIHTEWIDGFLVEDGPDSFISYRPAAAVLARELGLGGEIIGTTDPRTVHIRTGGRFVPLPDGIGLVLPTRMAPFLLTGLFSPLEKLAMARDLLLPRSPAAEDISIGRFLRRRLGSALVARLGDPLIGGIYGASVDELSLDAVVPQLRSAEREHRSLLLASLAQGRARARAAAAGNPASKGSPFLSFRGGMGALVDTLAGRLAADPNVRIRLGVGVADLGRAAGGLSVRLSDGSKVRADGVILAGPASASAAALAELAPAVVPVLGGIPHGSTAVVSLAYRAEQLPGRPGHGFLVARDEPLAFSACTWSSAKWAGRAPDGWVLARAFLGERSPGLLARPDDEVAAAVHADLARMAGIAGSPAFSRVARWAEAMPRYTIGHLGRVAALDEAMRALPEVAVVGAAVRGVGVPDCVDQGRAAARRIATVLGGSATVAA